MTQHPDISIIAAVAADGAIGVKGDMPFHISADLKRFKRLTMGHPLVMGRRTFESLPGGALPGRRNIVITRNASFAAEGAERAASLDQALDMCAGADRIMIIGGGQVYSDAIPLASSMHLTHIHADAPGADTFFPTVDPSEWEVTETSEAATDPRSGAEYHFVDYIRK